MTEFPELAGYAVDNSRRKVQNVLTDSSAGGIAYTVGVPFYAATKVRYSHFVWHLFVVVGTACHFIAVLLYAA